MESFVPNPKRKGMEKIRQQGFFIQPGIDDFTTTGNVSLTSVADGDMVTQYYRNLTVDTGHVLTVSNRCKGLCLIIYGDLTVSGEITMTGMGAAGLSSAAVQGVVTSPLSFYNLFVNRNFSMSFPDNLSMIDKWLQNKVPSATIEAQLVTARLWPLIDSSTELPLIGTIPIIGANGNSTRSTGNGGAGDAGTNRQTGGGGGGGGGYQYTQGYGGRGARGQLWGGGGGGGGAWGGGTGTYGGDATEGGAGGNALVNATYPNNGGGAGFPGGAGDGGGSNGGTGAGGLLIICCLGNILINAAGKITAYGVAGGNASRSGGGGSGGGSINIARIGSYTNNGTVSAAGGAAGTGASGHSGGAGGAGCVTVEQIRR